MDVTATHHHYVNIKEIDNEIMKTFKEVQTYSQHTGGPSLSAIKLKIEVLAEIKKALLNIFNETKRGV